MAKETKLRRADAKSANTLSKTASVGSKPGTASPENQSSSAGTGGTSMPTGFEVDPSGISIDPSGLSAVYTSRIWSYRVDSNGLNLILKNEKARSFSCSNSAPHYAAVLSMVIVAASTNALVSLRYSDRLATLPITYPISQFGLGESPLSES